MWRPPPHTAGPAAIRILEFGAQSTPNLHDTRARTWRLPDTDRLDQPQLPAGRHGRRRPSSPVRTTVQACIGPHSGSTCRRASRRFFEASVHCSMMEDTLLFWGPSFIA